MNTGVVIVLSLLCFLVGFITNELIRTKKKDENKVPFKDKR